MENTVYVIRSIHDPNKRKYDEKIINVPAEAADEQLSKPEDQRNFYWKGVRYATEEEKAVYLGIENTTEEKPARGRPKAIKE